QSVYTLLVNPTLGDVSLDGQLTNADLQTMLIALADQAGYASANGLAAADLVTLGDVNGDHAFDAADLRALMSLLPGASAGGGAATPVPEPSATVLLTLGAALLALAARKIGRDHCTFVATRSR